MKTICITCKNDCNNAGTTARISWCPQYKPGRILSNAERIRAMSDEELEAVQAELERVKRERDAAVEDLHKLCPAWKWDGQKED